MTKTKKIDYTVVFNPHSKVMYVAFKSKLSFIEFEDDDETHDVDNIYVHDDDYLAINDIWLEFNLRYDQELRLSANVRMGEEYGDTLFEWTHGVEIENVHIVHTDQEMIDKLKTIDDFFDIENIGDYVLY